MRIASDVAWVDAEDLPGSIGPAAAYVVRLPDGSPLALTGAAWAIWIALAEAGPSGLSDTDEISRRAAGLMEIPVSGQVAADVATFLDQLICAGLVVCA